MTLKTGDLAICTETSACTIHAYNEQGLLGPAHRQANSSYRSYDPRVIPQVYLIKVLRELGCGSREIKEYGRVRTPETTLELFRGYCGRLAREIAERQAQMDVLQSYAALIEEGVAAKPDAIALRELPEQRVRRCALENHGVKTKNTERLRHAHGEIRQSGNPGCPLGYAYGEFFDLLEQPDQPAQLVSYDPQGPDTRPAGEYLVGTVACLYGEKTGLPRRMYSHALQNGLEFTGSAYAVYLFDAASTADAERCLLQIAVMVKKAEKI